jgi:hypothetical protein
MRAVSKGQGRKLLLLAILWVTLLAPASVGQQAQSGPCACSDLNDLKARLFTVEEAIRLFGKAYLNQAVNGPWSPEAWNVVEPPIRQALDNLCNPYPRQPNPQTGKVVPDSAVTYRDWKSCKVTLDLATACCKTDFEPGLNSCLLSSLTAHENVHLNRCRESENWRTSGQTVKDAIFEEVESYNRERRFLKEQIHKLECSCPYYAVNFNYLGVVSVQNRAVQDGNVTVTGGPGQPATPVEIPLTLKDDGSVSGESTLVLQGNGTLKAQPAACNSKDDTLIHLRLSGSVTGPEDATQLHLQVSNEAPPVTETTGRCWNPYGSIPFHAVTSGDNANLSFDFPQAEVGAQKGAKLFTMDYAAMMGLYIDLRAAAQIAETKEKSDMTSKEVSNCKAPQPHFLPNCKAGSP